MSHRAGNRGEKIKNISTKKSKQKKTLKYVDVVFC